MRKIKLYLFTIVLAGIAFVFLLSGVAVSKTHQSGEISRVLILLSYHDTHSWTAGILDGVKNELAASDLKYELHVEFMDTKRHNPDDMFPQLEKLYRTKYRDIQLDLIIVSDNNALNFLLPRRNALFPGTPVVFCGINNFTPSLIKGFDHITGVAEASDFAGTIELALKLQPGTRHVAVVCDHTSTGIAHIKDIRNIFPDFTDRVEFIELLNQTEEELQEALRNLPEKSIVFMLSFYIDRSGKHFTIPEQARIITETSGVPVYTAWDISLGFGVVGGVMTNGRSQGKNAAQLALRILGGESPEQIAIVSKSPNIPTLDYRVAKHFNLPLSELSAGTVFINKPKSFYDEHRRIIWVTLLIFLCQFLVIFFLVLNVRKRRQAEQRLNEQGERLKDIVNERTTELSLTNKELLLEVDSRKKAEVAIRKSDEQWDRTFNSFTDIVTLQDTDLCIVKTNQAASATLGLFFDQIIGYHCYELFHGSNEPCEDCPLLATKEFFSPYTREMYHKKLERTFLVSASPVFDNQGNLEYIAHVAKDITEIKQLEDKLFQSQKMEAIGTMASGIAHDFNNILSAIIGYAEFIREDVPKESQTGKNIAEVLAAGNRAAELVKQILAVTRQVTTEKQIIQPHLIVREALKMMCATMPATVTIHEDIDPGCGRIKADPTILHQIVVNLCTNALQAMVEQKGTMHVELQRRQLSAAEINERENVSPGPFVVLTVRDSGCGMDQSTIDRCFEPYFTTKEIGRGTGLGLAIIHGAAEEYKGFVTVESRVGKGTVFSVCFPLTEKPVRRPVAPKQKKGGKVVPGDVKLLVVDDELLLVKLNERRLTGRGYQVTAVSDSREALEVFTRQPDSFDLLVTDQTMPGLSGVELVKAVLEIKPSLPIIMCTGHSDVVSEEEAIVLGIKKYVFKPLLGDELLDAVQEVLAGK